MAELVVNGDFAVDTGWTLGANCTVTGGQLQIGAPGGASFEFTRRSLGTVTNGATWDASLDYVSNNVDGGGLLNARVRNGVLDPGGGGITYDERYGGGTPGYAFGGSPFTLTWSGTATATEELFFEIWIDDNTSQLYVDNASMITGGGGGGQPTSKRGGGVPGMGGGRILGGGGQQIWAPSMSLIVPRFNPLKEAA